MKSITIGRTVWLAIALALAALLAWQGTITPKPVPASASADSFSTERALKDIAVIAREPHPLGSPANARVRDYLIARMTELGLSPTVQAADALSPISPDSPEWLTGAHVENVIGILPGKDRTAPALMLMSHYDSVPNSPGAADDAAGVASSLEVIRAIKARGVPARDIIVLVTDGEEWGLSGAEAFFKQHPLAKRTGLIINMEARGNGGRANMFETGRDNGELIKVFKASADKPISSALAVFLYEKMPNDTDFSVPKRMGIQGLNFAFIGRQFDYHSPTATVANLDRGSVQSMGDQVLAATIDLAFAPKLPGKAPSAVYSQTFGDHVLAYPPVMGWLVLALVGGLLVLAGWRAKQAGESLRWRDGLRGAAIALATTLMAALLLHLARRWTGVQFGFVEQRPLLAAWPFWEAAIFVIGLATALIGAQLAGKAAARRWLTPLLCLALGGLSSLAGGFDPLGLGLGVAASLLFLVRGPAIPRSAAWAGVLCLGFGLAVLMQLFAAQTAFLIAWPLTLAALGAAVSRWGAQLRFTPLLAALAAVACGWLGVYVHLTAQGLDFPALLGVFVLLALFVLWPLAQPEGPYGRAGAWTLIGTVLLVVGGGICAIWATYDPWTERYPAIDSVVYVSDSHSGGAWTVYQIQDGGGLSIFKDYSDPAADGITISTKLLQRASLPPLYDRPVFVLSADPVPVATPTFASRIEADGRVTLALTPPPGARIARLNIKLSAAVKDVTVQGRRTTWLARPGDVQRLRWAGIDKPITVSFRPVKPDAGLAEVDYGTIVETWPEGVVRDWPAPTPSMPWNLSGSTGVTGKALVRW
jgi:hypothetical protein